MVSKLCPGQIRVSSGHVYLASRLLDTLYGPGAGDVGE
jgi:hypothetical protein